MKLAFPRLSCSLILLATLSARGAAPDEVEGQAPPNSALLRHTLGGAYFVAQPLKEEYDKLLARVRTLEADLDAGRIDGTKVLAELKELKPRLQELRSKIEQEKVLVSPLKVHTQKEETTFDLGAERLIVITARRVHIEGWSGPQIKCVLTKTVFSADDKPVDDSFAAIKVVHRYAEAAQLVGQAGVDHHNDDFAHYGVFQGKKVDAIEITGLHEGVGPNSELFYTIKSPGGQSTGTTVWRHHAELTVYVPQCEALALHGASEGIEIQGLHGALVLQGSMGEIAGDSSYVRDLTGSLVSDGIAIKILEDIHGDVTLIERRGSTSQTMRQYTAANGGPGNTNDVYTPPPQTLACRNISGDFTARLLQTKLTLENVGGRVDVLNEFGSTSWTITSPLASKAHRIISQSGQVEARFSTAMLNGMRLEALSNCGIVRDDIPRDQHAFELTMQKLDNSFGAQREWCGLETAVANPGKAAASDRLAAVLQGRDREPGVDLLSHAGVVLLHLEH